MAPPFGDVHVTNELSNTSIKPLLSEIAPPFPEEVMPRNRQKRNT
jgi:hypothetical protein